MAWFKFGKSSDSAALSDAPVETAESLRTRAKRRLIGALVLVLTAVVGFPLLFDTQPRPVLVDVPIEIPDKAKVKPLTLPPASTAAQASAPAGPAPAARVDENASLQAREEIVQPGPVIVKPNTPSAQSSTAQTATKSIAIPLPTSEGAKAAADKAVAEKAAKDKAASDKATAEKAASTKAAAEKAENLKAAAEKAENLKAAAEKAAAAKAQEAARAKALLEGKPTTPAATAPAVAPLAATGERFIVQFGSFAEEVKAREVRQKVERAGLKTYAQVAQTSEGKRFRVRVGPFATRAEADKAANKIKALDLPAAILTL